MQLQFVSLIFIVIIIDVSVEERNQNIANLNMQFKLLTHHKSVENAYMEIVNTRSYSMVSGISYNNGPSIPPNPTSPNPTSSSSSTTTTTTTTTDAQHEEDDDVFHDEVFHDEIDEDLSCSILSRPSRLALRYRRKKSVHNESGKKKENEVEPEKEKEKEAEEEQHGQKEKEEAEEKQKQKEKEEAEEKQKQKEKEEAEEKEKQKEKEEAKEKEKQKQKEKEKETDDYNNNNKKKQSEKAATKEKTTKTKANLRPSDVRDDISPTEQAYQQNRESLRKLEDSLSSMVNTILIFILTRLLLLAAWGSYIVCRECFSR